jgi:hypothetical protein
MLRLKAAPPHTRIASSVTRSAISAAAALTPSTKKHGIGRTFLNARQSLIQIASRGIDGNAHLREPGTDTRHA